MDHDVSAWIDVRSSGSGTVLLVRVRDVQGAVGCTVRVVAVDDIVAFGVLEIALLLLRSNGGLTEPDAVDAEDVGSGEEGHAVLGFFDDDAISLLLGEGRCGDEQSGEDAGCAQDGHGLSVERVDDWEGKRSCFAGRVCRKEKRRIRVDAPLSLLEC